MKKEINDILIKMQNNQLCIGEAANELLKLLNSSADKWEYAIKKLRIPLNSVLSITDEFNDFGKYGWEVFSFTSTPYCVQVGSHNMQVATLHEVFLKRRVNSFLE